MATLTLVGILTFGIPVWYLTLPQKKSTKIVCPFQLHSSCPCKDVIHSDPMTSFTCDSGINNHNQSKKGGTNLPKKKFLDSLSKAIVLRVNPLCALCATLGHVSNILPKTLKLMNLLNMPASTTNIANSSSRAYYLPL